jgi:tetratricopeptide (TPR) repeat protein
LKSVASEEGANKCKIRKASVSHFSEELNEKIRELKDALGSSHPDVAFTIHTLGDACSRNGDYEEAYRYYMEALELKKDVLCPAHPNIADTISALGFATKTLGMIEDSINHFETALVMYQNAFDDRSWVKEENNKPQVEYYLYRQKALVLSGVGSLLFRENKFSEALSKYDLALVEGKQASVSALMLHRQAKYLTPAEITNSFDKLKESRLLIADILNNIASVHSELGQKDEAIKYYHEALSLEMKELGEDNPTVACTLHNIGTMNFRSGELNILLKSYKQVMKMRRNILGPGHPSIADALINIAIVHEKEGDIDKAESALLAALNIAQQSQEEEKEEEESIKVANIRQLLGSLYARNGREEYALSCYNAALQSYVNAGLSSSSQLIQSASSDIAYIKYKDKSDFSYMVTVAKETMNSILDQGCFAFWGPSEFTSLSQRSLYSIH